MKPLGDLNRIILGLVMLIPGLLKLFVSGPSGVSGFLSGIMLFAWAPLFFAWLLIILEIGSGIAILGKWKLEYTTIPPIIILAVAMLFVTIQWDNLGATGWPSVLLHLAVISNYLLLGCYGCKKKR